MRAEPFVSPILSDGRRVILGEGPHVVEGVLSTVDARQTVLRLTDLHSRATRDVDVFKLLVEQGFLTEGTVPPVLGCAAPTVSGRYLLGLACGLFLLDPQSGILSHLVHPEAERVEHNAYYNDGKVGPDGAFYVGGMVAGREGAGRLLRVTAEGEWSEPLDGAPPLTTPNGLQWYPTPDPDRWDFYYVCSQYPAIQRYTHILSEVRMVREADLVSLPRSEFGYLDGLTGSTEGILFLALYEPPGEGRLLAICRNSGTVVDQVVTEVPQTTSAILDGQELYVTTAAQEYGADAFRLHPNAGALFRARLETVFGGSVPAFLFPA